MPEDFDAKAFVARLPGLPGVYRMLGSGAEVLYVGKAKNLKKRVGSYFRKSGLSPRIAAMVAQISGIETTVVRSEAEALLLENNFIKSLAPRYNILFRDDKSYPYLMITGDRYPRLGFHRGAKVRTHQYFGPYPHSNAVRESIQLLQRIFRLRTCENSVFENRSRPCLLHQIERCSAPCTGEISPELYAEDVQNANLLLTGRHAEVARVLTASMHEASAALRFEQAAVLRDKIKAITQVQARQYVESARGGDADVVGCAEEGQAFCVNLAMIRGGRHVGDRSFFPQNVREAGRDDVVIAFLNQHYAIQPMPPLVITNAQLDSTELELSTPGADASLVKIVTPIQGERKVWLDMALKNAHLALSQRMSERGTQEARLASMREALELPEFVQRIECFDISHTMGEATVASCVVFDATGMKNDQYRRFNIAGIEGGDDYAAMRQALSRRYSRLSAEDARLPDLVLIDGGKGQVASARDALAELGLNEVLIVGIAKGPERKAGMEQLILESDGRVIRLAPSHPGLLLIQTIRDEAHRFAIVGHRARRSKLRQTSVLLEIPGVGNRRRQSLLAHFGGLQGLQAAAVDEIAAVEGIGRSLAMQIHNFLHDAGATT